MALLDPRILPLIETFAASGMDWLAFELVESIRFGRQQEETEEALAQAREQASNPRQIDSSARDYSGEAEAKAILGNDQLIWAAEYVERRFIDVIGALDAAFEHLDTIAQVGADASGGQSAGSIHLVLSQDEQSFEVAKSDTAVAWEGLQALRIALKEWLADNLDQGLLS
jgi:hypothetical protein